MVLSVGLPASQSVRQAMGHFRFAVCLEFEVSLGTYVNYRKGNEFDCIRIYNSSPV